MDRFPYLMGILFVAALTLPACSPSASAQSSTVPSIKPELVYSPTVTIDGRRIRLPSLEAKNGQTSRLTQTAPGSPAGAKFDLTVTPEILPDGKIRSVIVFNWIENEVPFSTQFTATTDNRELTGVTETSGVHETRFEIRATRP